MGGCLTKTQDHRVNEAEIVQETEPATPPLTTQPAPKGRKLKVLTVKFPPIQAPARQVLREVRVRSSKHKDRLGAQSPPLELQEEPEWGCPQH